MAMNPNWEKDWKDAQSRLHRQTLGFEKVFSAFIDKVVSEKVLKITQKVAFGVLDGATNNTPVDTGRARANWNIGINQPDLTVEDPPEGMTKEEITKMVTDRGVEVIKTAKPFDIIIISNNVEYIDVLERGWSKQAPEGMLGMTLDQIQAKIQAGDYS